MRWVLVCALALACVLATVGGPAEADFAAAKGFSGRYGSTCVSCHATTLPTPEPATLRIDGLPQEWEPATPYPITIEVSGGPPAIPGTPMGGFELDLTAGRIEIPPSMAAYLATFGPAQLTYTPEGTTMRTWEAIWISPNLDHYPPSIQWWSAALASNGNHNAQLNASLGGEFGDAEARLEGAIEPSESTLDAWRELPLLAPSVEVLSEDRLSVRLDANATALRVQQNAGPVRQIPASGTVTIELAESTKSLRLQSIGQERRSPTIVYEVATHSVVAVDTPPPVRATPVPVAWIPIGVALWFATTSSRRSYS